MKNNKNTLNSILITIILIIIIIFMFILVLSKFNTGFQEYSKQICDKMNGTLIFYECQCNIGSDCEDLKCGNYCKLNNGTEVDVNFKGDLV